MKKQELEFCELYEKRLKMYELLDLLKNELTITGFRRFKGVRNWLITNLDKYLELTKT